MSAPLAEVIAWLLIGTGGLVACVAGVIWIRKRRDQRQDENIHSAFTPGGTLDDEYLFRRFVGPNQDYYVEIWKRVVPSAARGRRVLARRWNWAAALCFFPWALYRKIWLWAFAVPIVTVAVAVAVPAINPWPHVFAIGITGWWGNELYVRHAATRAEKIKLESASDEEMIIHLDRAGGVSRIAAWFGAIVFASINLLSLFVVLHVHKYL
jgi:hypothetical protein